ncbi:hypothetical protein BDW75DRAFT_215949 [Aspergillus navahoensis]
MIPSRTSCSADSNNPRLAVALHNSSSPKAHGDSQQPSHRMSHRRQNERKAVPRRPRATS